MSLTQPPPDSDPMSPLRLQYAASPQRLGIVHETTTNGVRITIPAKSSQTGCVITLLASIVLGAVLITWLGMRFGMSQLFAKAYYALPLTGVIFQVIAQRVTSSWHFSKPSTIELTLNSLVFVNVLILNQRKTVTRPRSQIREVKYIPHSGNLVIRCHIESMIECCPVRDPIVLEWIATVLNEALRLP